MNDIPERRQAMTIHESAEDYLEAILILHQRNGSVRSIDIAEELSVSKPSVSVAMKKLRTDSYIEMDDMGLITLLPKGQEIAQRIYERHTFLEAWLMRLGVSAKTAEADACKIEHDIHPETFAAIQKYVSATLDQYSAK